MQNSDKPVLLFIDDEQFLLNAYQRMFRKSAWHCFYSPSLQDARLLLEQYPVQLILCDYYLTDGTAVEFFDGLDSRFSKIKRILLSGSSDSLKEQMIGSATVDAIVHKPCSKTELIAVIEHCLG